MARVPELGKLVKEKTRGVLGFLSDYVLFQLLFFLELPGAGYGSSNVWRASQRSTEEFFRIKEEQFESTLRNLRAGGYVSFSGESSLEVTKKGWERVKRKASVYEEKRPWDGNLYLITYDVPVSQNRERSVLRRILRRLGCTMLQESFWITPYDPQGILRSLAEKLNLGGYLIVSKVGEGGAIGGEDFKSLVWKAYRLEGLDRQYREFVRKASRASPSLGLVFEYLSLLKADPQLPFELLPPDWIGKKAFECYRKLAKNLPGILTGNHVRNR